MRRRFLLLLAFALCYVALLGQKPTAVSQLWITSTPTNDNSRTQVLVRDETSNGIVEYRTAASLLPTLGTSGQMPFVNSGATNFTYSSTSPLWIDAQKTFKAGGSVTFSGSALTPSGGGNSIVIGESIDISNDYSWSAIFGDVHDINVSFNNNQLSGTGFTVNGGAVSNSLINSNGTTYSGAGAKGNDLVTGSQHTYNVSGGSGNNFITGGLNTITGTSIVGAHVSGTRGQVSASGTFVHAYPIASQSTRPIIASGLASINMSSNHSTQCSGCGARANYSGIFAGRNSDIDPGAVGSVVIGGFGLQVTDSATAMVPNLQISGSWKRAVSTVTSSTTLNSTHNVVLSDDSGGSITITLPAASTCSGRIYTIIKTSASNSTIVDGNSSETINGNPDFTMGAQYGRVTIVSNGTEWFIVAL